MLLYYDYWGLYMKSSDILNNPEFVHKFPSSVHLLPPLLTRMGSISHSAKDVWKVNCCYNIAGDSFWSKLNYSGIGCLYWILFLVLHWLYHLHESDEACQSSTLKCSEYFSWNVFHLGNANVFRIKAFRERLRHIFQVNLQSQWSQHLLQCDLWDQGRDLTLAIPKKPGWLFFQNEIVEFHCLTISKGKIWLYSP